MIADPNKTQAEIIIDMFGGAVALARLLNVNKSTVYRWTYEECYWGTDGRVPERHHQTLRDLAELLDLSTRKLEAALRMDA